MRCCFCGHERGGVYTKRLDSVAGPLDCCSHCDASFRERDRIASFERAVLAACVEEANAEDAHALGRGGPCDVNDARAQRQAASRAYRAALEEKGPPV